MKNRPPLKALPGTESLVALINSDAKSLRKAAAKEIAILRTIKPQAAPLPYNLGVNVETVKPRPGPRPGSGKGRQTKSASISFTPSGLDRIDKLRGTLPRGKFIESKIP